MTALTVFRQVVELGSFAAAARSLRLSPAAASKNIGELEASLGVRLLNRTTRRVSPTEAGALYYHQIAQVLNDLATADSSLGPLQQVPAGVLRVSAPTTLTLLSPLSRAMPKFLKRYPELSVDLTTDDRRVDIVGEGFDVAIRAIDNLGDTSLIARKLTVTPHVVCGAPDYFDRAGIPNEPSELRHHTCVQFTLSGHPDEWVFRRGERSVRVPIDGRYKVTSSFVVRDALLDGFGLSLMPWIYVRDEVEQGRLRIVLTEWSAVELSVYALYPSRRYTAPKVRAFIDFLVEELARRSHPMWAKSGATDRG